MIEPRQNTQDDEDVLILIPNYPDFLYLMQDLGVDQSYVGRHVQKIYEQAPIPDVRMSFSGYRELIELAVKKSGNPALGLLFGSRISISGADPVLSMGILAATSFINALEFAQKGVSVVNPMVDFKIHVEGQRLCVDIVESFPLGNVEIFMVDAALSFFTAWVRILDYTILEHIEYHIKCDPGEAAATYRNFFSGKVFFSAPYNRISFPESVREKPMPFANPRAVAEAEAALNKLLVQTDHIPDKIVSAIQKAVRREPEKTPMIEDVAKTFFMSPRTLNRRLSQQGVSFKDVVYAERKAMAMELLANLDLSVDQVAAALGYCHAPNFSSAFKGWTGISPTAYRDKLKR